MMNTDPLIQSLFPDRHSQTLNQSFDSNTLSLHPELLPQFMAVPPWDTSIHPTFLNCDFDLSNMTQHYNVSVFPSPFARKNLLYLQLLASCTFSATHYTKRENLPSYLIAHTFYGEGRLVYHDKEYELRPGDLFFIHCTDQHTYYAASEEGWGYRFIHFDGAPMEAYFHQFERPEAVRFSFPDDSRFYRSLQELYQVNASSGPQQEILTNRILTDLLTELLLSLPDYQNKTLPDEITRQCIYLQNHYNEKISLEQLARRFQVSKYHMCREFKKYTGQTIYAYLTDYRITISKNLLRYSGLSVNEISTLAGFDDYTNFYRTFIHIEEMSPSEYRKHWSGL
jgi:AraC-like DNA-binding protein